MSLRLIVLLLDEGSTRRWQAALLVDCSLRWRERVLCVKALARRDASAFTIAIITTFFLGEIGSWCNMAMMPVLRGNYDIRVKCDHVPGMAGASHMRTNTLQFPRQPNLHLPWNPEMKNVEVWRPMPRIPWCMS